MAEKCTKIRVKLLLRISFCLAMIAAMVIIGAVMVGAIEYDCGPCGDNLVWKLDDSGLLDISGTGDMWEDYSFDYYSHMIREVVIREGVTGISNGAFQSCSLLTSVVIPEGMTSIGDLAFGECSNLKSVELPDSLTYLGELAFADCYQLQSIKIPSGITEIGWAAFAGCKNIQQITISEGVTSIGKYAFAMCGSLKNVEIPQSVQKIGEGAFQSCTSLESITFPDNLTRIESDMFIGCENLKNFVIPPNVTQIGSEAFEHCHSLKNISIPDSVTTIEHYAFDGCSSLTHITLPKNVTSIGWGAFSNCVSLKSITMYDRVTSIGPIYNCHDFTDIYFHGTPAQWYDIEFKGEGDPFKGVNIHYLAQEGYFGEDGDNLYWKYDFLAQSLTISGNGKMEKDGFGEHWSHLTIRKLIIEEGVENVSSWAFYNNKDLEKVYFPNSMREIAGQAFAMCEKLKEVIIPEGVTTISIAAFGSCPSLERVQLPSTLKTIESDAFDFCRNLKYINIPESVTFIGDGTFYDCLGLKSIVFSGEEIHIDSGGFYYCRGVENVAILNDRAIIDGYAFGHCYVLKSVTIANGDIHIKQNAFANCISITDVFFLGTEEEWKNISIEETGNSALLNANIHFIVDEFKITGASLTLGESITMKYYATSTLADAKLKMRFAYADKITVADGIFDASTGEYVFTLSGITPQCIADNIRADLILVDENGFETVVACKGNYSVRQYCDDALAANPNNEALATLLADLLAYGDASQKYTGYQEEAPVSDGFPASPSEWQEVTSTDFTLTDSTRDDIRFTAAGVRFAYVNRIYFKIKAADLTGVTVTIDGKAYFADDLELVENTDGTYILYTDAIYATEFDKVFTAELSVDGDVIQTVTYSVKSYVYAKQNTENDRMAELARALYNYGLSAVAYKNAQ